MNFHRDRDDHRLLRSADADRAAETSRVPDPVAAAGRRWLGTTAVGATYPQAAARFFLVQPVQVTGAEVEGGAADVAAVGTAVLCYNTGDAIPPVGQPVEVTSHDYRQTFAWYG